MKEQIMKELFRLVKNFDLERIVKILSSIDPGVAVELLKTIKAAIVCGGGCLCILNASEKGHIDRILDILERKIERKEAVTV